MVCALCMLCTVCSWCTHHVYCVWPVHCVCHCSWCTATQPSVCTHCTVTACVPMCTALSALVRPSPMAPAHSPRAHHAAPAACACPLCLPLTAPSAWGPCAARCATWLCGAAAGALAPHCGCSLACGAATRVQCCACRHYSLRLPCAQGLPSPTGGHPHTRANVVSWLGYSSPPLPLWPLLSRVCDCHACPPLCVQ